MSKRFQLKFGLLHVSTGKALRRTITEQAHTALAGKIQECLYQGGTVPDNLAMESVANMVLNTRSTTRG